MVDHRDGLEPLDAGHAVPGRYDEPERETAAPPELATALGATPLYVGRNRMDYLIAVGSEALLRELNPDFSLLRRVDTRGLPAGQTTVEFSGGCGAAGLERATSSTSRAFPRRPAKIFAGDAVKASGRYCPSATPWRKAARAAPSAVKGSWARPAQARPPVLLRRN